MSSTRRIAVAGGTGNVGRRVVDRLRAQGHDAVVISRSTGVDLRSGHGLAEALDGVDAVIDAISTESADAAAAVEYFGTATTNLLAAEQAAGVGHHVLLSIVAVDRVGDRGHELGKRRQEELVGTGPVPWTILRAAQFFDFPAMVAGWVATDGAAVLPPLLLQPVSIDDVAEALADLAGGATPAGRVELAGAETHDFVDMARRTLTARGQELRLTASWRGIYGVELAGEAMLPGPDARIGARRFDDWLAVGAP